jgi:hypothetical protein
VTADEGMQRLVFHTTPSPESFLGMLRPYGGLRQEVLADVSDALRASAPKMSGELFPRELASAVWAISYYGRCWALAPNGMLRANRLITDADLNRLSNFLEWFDYAVMTLLDSGASQAAFEENPFRW